MTFTQPDHSLLSNEAKAAMEKLDRHWNLEKQIFDNIAISESDIQTDYFEFCQRPIILHKGINWRWNKTSVVRNLRLRHSNTNVTLSKMQSRSKVKGQKTPSFKIWLYEIQSTEKIFACWIERGWNLPEVEELSFLAAFVEESVAREFNWSVGLYLNK